MKHSLRLFLAIALCTIENAAGHPIVKRETEFSLNIVHNNDMHARFEQTSKLSATCSQKDADANNCYGGFARVATLVRQARNSTVPTLFLNAGDTYQGSIWFNIFKWTVVARFLNILAPDAMSLGNHEFDEGVEGLVPFIRNASFPVLAANLDVRNEPALREAGLKSTTVLEVEGHKIGVIGYLTPDTKVIAWTGNVIFEDEVVAIKREVQRLKQEGVNILIALGHSGFGTDKRIAEEVEDIDLVIGGHSNTFLYNGEQPDSEIPEGLYPTEVTQKSGRKTYVVQAYAYTKYLGNLSLVFDEYGEIKSIKGSPILIDSSIEQAKDVLEELDKWRPAIVNATFKEIGTTRVLLDGDSKSCRRQECNFGNLITDAMLEYEIGQYVIKDNWTDAPIAVQNSGTIRTSITRNNEDKVTVGDIIAALPFDDSIEMVVMPGETMLEMLEWSVGTLHPSSTADLAGAFLQVSGLHVRYDLSKPYKSRVVDVEVRCGACAIPIYEKLQKNATYNVLMTSFMRSGGDGYSMLKDLRSTPVGATLSEVVMQYFQRRSPVHPNVEWRITFENSMQTAEENVTGGAASVRYSSFAMILSIVTVFISRH